MAATDCVSVNSGKTCDWPVSSDDSPDGIWSLDICLRFLPKGAVNNSPAVHCRVLDTSATSPEGTAELFPQIAFVILNPVLFQQRDEFLLKTHFAVMRLLVFELSCPPPKHSR